MSTMKYSSYWMKCVAYSTYYTAAVYIQHTLQDSPLWYSYLAIIYVNIVFSSREAELELPQVEKRGLIAYLYQNSQILQ